MSEKTNEELAECVEFVVKARRDGLFEIDKKELLEAAARLRQQSEDSACLLSALSEAADELDSYYRTEYMGADAYPSVRRKLDHAIANNPARIAIDKARKA